MRLLIDGYRGVERAEVEIGGISLITGPNASGKTSIAQAAAAALTGAAVPLDGLRKSDAGALVRSGAARGSVVLRGENGEAAVTWPEAKVVTEGAPPRASAIAAGLESIADMRREDRAKALMPYLDAEPIREDLAAALPFLKPEHLDKLMGSIETNGWDGAHGQAKDKGVNLKGRWEQATGERYGAKKGARWLPGDWDKELEATSEQTLQDALAQEREFLEAAIATHAIDDEKRRELEARAAAIPELAKKVTKLDLAQQEVKARWYEARNELREMLPAGRPATQPCPHCGGDLVVDGGKITLPPDHLPTQEEIDRRNAAIDAKRQEVSLIEQEHARAVAAWQEAEQELRAATDAKVELEKAPEPEGEAGDMEECRERVRRAEARLKAFAAKREADRLHAAIEANQSTIDALAPGGLRAKKLADALRRFNSEALAPLCKAADWRPVEIGKDLLPTYGGRPYPLISASEQYRVRVALQVALARLEGSDLVVIDAADILDRAGRNGLIKMLCAAGIPAIVCMTVGGKTPPPDFAAAGLGCTYRIDAGVAAPLPTDGKEAA
jgi:energy-coupling factor transporter ATP-binding protein EcfA2